MEFIVNVRTLDAIHLFATTRQTVATCYESSKQWRKIVTADSRA